MNKLVLGLLFISIFQSAYAQDGIGELYHFTEDVRNIVWESAPLPEEFVLSEEDTDRAAAYIGLDQEIGEYAFSQTEKPAPGSDQPCPQLSSSDGSKKALEQKIKDRKYNLYFTMTFNDAEAVGLAEGFMGKNNFNTFMLQQANSGGNSKAFEIQSLSKLTQKFKAKNPNSNFDSLGIKEREKLLIDFANDTAQIEIPKGMLMSEIAIAHAIQNPSSWKVGMSEIKDELSFNQKVLVASHLGGKFSDRYNYDRAEEGSGVVTIEEMLSSVRDGHPGGICRDVSMAQSAILKELGVPKDKIYQIGYSTAGGGHAVVAIQDPDNPKNIVKLNYGYVTESNGAVGSSALVQNTSLPDFGINNRIYDADGDPVGKLPTEIGEILYDSSGGNKGKITPPSRHNLQKVGVQTPFGAGNVFTGETSSGDKVVGVTLQKSINLKYLDNDVAAGFISRKGDRSTVSISQEAFYVRAKSTLNSPSFEQGNFSFSSRLGLETELFAMTNRVKPKGSSETEDSNYDATFSPFIGASANWKSDDKRTEVISDIEVEGNLVNKNIQLSGEEGMTVGFNKATFRTGMSHTVSNEMKVVGQTGIIMRQMGSSAHFSGGILKETPTSNLRAIASYSAPLSKDVPAFLPEAQRNFGLSIGGEQKKSGIYYQLNYNRDLDNNSNAVGLSAGWKF